MADDRPDNRLPDSTFILTDKISDEDLQLLYQEIVARLRKEASAVPTFGTLHELMIERVSFLYVYMRQKERGAIEERKLKEIMALWQGVAGEIFRQGKSAADEEKLRTMIVDSVIDRVSHVLDSTLEPEAAREMKRNLALSLSDANF